MSPVNSAWTMCKQCSMSLEIVKCVHQKKRKEMRRRETRRHRRRHRPWMQTYSMCLDMTETCVYVFISRFLPFFFFLVHICWFFEDKIHYLWTVHALFTHCACTITHLKILKIGPMTLFTHLKIILLQYFQFSIFSFSNNKFNSNGPIKYVYIILATKN